MGRRRRLLCSGNVTCRVGCHQSRPTPSLEPETGTPTVLGKEIITPCIYECGLRNTWTDFMPVTAPGTQASCPPLLLRILGVSHVHTALRETHPGGPQSLHSVHKAKKMMESHSYQKNNASQCLVCLPTSWQSSVPSVACQLLSLTCV